jgi:hypothetical protein
MKKKELIKSFASEVEHDYAMNGNDDFDISIYSIMTEGRIKDLTSKEYVYLDDFVKEIQRVLFIKEPNLDSYDKQLLENARVGFIMEKLGDNDIKLLDIYYDWKQEYADFDNFTIKDGLGNKYTMDDIVNAQHESADDESELYNLLELKDKYNTYIQDLHGLNICKKYGKNVTISNNLIEFVPYDTNLQVPLIAEALYDLNQDKEELSELLQNDLGEIAFSISDYTIDGLYESNLRLLEANVEVESNYNDEFALATSNYETITIDKDGDLVIPINKATAIISMKIINDHYMEDGKFLADKFMEDYFDQYSEDRVNINDIENFIQSGYKKMIQDDLSIKKEKLSTELDIFKENKTPEQYQIITSKIAAINDKIWVDDFSASIGFDITNPQNSYDELEDIISNQVFPALDEYITDNQQDITKEEDTELRTQR